MKYLAMAMMAALTIVTLIGLMPDAHAGECFQKASGRVVCCTVVAGFPYCN
jgi:hypothetical protein